MERMRNRIGEIVGQTIIIIIGLMQDIRDNHGMEENWRPHHVSPPRNTMDLMFSF